MCPGHESWHPNPEFYYKHGGGPMLDMGPYYLTALVNMLGPVKRVAGSTRISFPTRTITSQPLAGKVVTVDVPTHVTGLLEFAGGAIGNIITSFDISGTDCPIIEVYGSEGTLSVPDPNSFGGKVRLLKRGQKDWTEVPISDFTYPENHRGIGLADMANAIRSGRQHRANGELAFHVLDLMHALHESSDKGRHVTLKSTCNRPLPMATGLADGEIDP
jgi:predicted dehydrogenase